MSIILGTLIGFKRTMYTVDEGSSIMIDVVQNGAVNGTGEVRVSTNNGQALGIHTSTLYVLSLF